MSLCVVLCVQIAGLTCSLILYKHLLLLKHMAKKAISLKCGETFLADKIKLVLNGKKEIVLISTSLTVLRQETEEPHESAESIELS